MSFLSKAIKFGTGGLIDLEGLKGTEQGIGRGIDAQNRMFDISRRDLAPYRAFGEEQLGGLKNYLNEDIWNPSMEEVMSQPGYSTRLGAIENSAAARGGLFSGNALRDIGEFGEDEYNSYINRKRQELMDRLGLVNVGYGASTQSAGLNMNQGNALANLYSAQGQAKTSRTGLPLQLAATVGGYMLGNK